MNGRGKPGYDKVRSIRVYKVGAKPAPAPSPATGKHDGSKCTDWGKDCCGSPIWGEPQTCKDGYVPKPDASCTLTTYKDCPKHHKGAGCYGCYPPEAAKPAPAPSPTGGECSAQAYCWSGCNMKSKNGPKGPYGENGGKWIDTANCIDTFHVPEGCAYEVATGKGGTGTKYTFTKSECMNGRGKPGYDRVRSIRVYKVGQGGDAAPAPAPSPTGTHDGSKCSDWGSDCCGSPIWGEPQTCKDGYVPKPDASCTLTTYKDCKKHEKGAGCYGCYPPEGAAPAPSPTGTGGECSAQAYCSSGCNMKSKNSPRGPYGENGGKWIDTANCIDTFHVPEGCAYEVATGKGGTGTKYTFTKSECMNGGGKPGYDRVRSIRVYKVGQGGDAAPAPAPSPTGTHDGSKCSDR